MAKELTTMSIVMGEHKFHGQIWSNLHDQYIIKDLQDNNGPPTKLALQFINEFKLQGNIKPDNFQIIDLEDLVKRIVNLKVDKTDYYRRLEEIKQCVNSTFVLFKDYTKLHISSQYGSDTYQAFIYTDSPNTFANWLLKGNQKPTIQKFPTLNQFGLRLTINGQKFKIGANTTYSANQFDDFEKLPPLIKFQTYCNVESKYDYSEFQKRVSKGTAQIFDKILAFHDVNLLQTTPKI